MLNLATVEQRLPTVRGPVGRRVLRGAFHFGSSPESLRFRHIAAASEVRRRHMTREEFAFTVHGRATPSTSARRSTAGFDRS